MADNQYGKRSCLEVEIVSKNGKSCLGKTGFSAPFKVMKPFMVRRGDKELLQLMLISVSAGIMAGDDQMITVRTGEHTSSEIISQSYEKIHKMPAGEARRQTSLIIGRDSFCSYHPLPAIPFAGSAFTAETEICLADDTSVLVYREILAGGRGASGELFAYRRYENKVRIRKNGAIVYYDNTIFEPEYLDMQGYGMLEGYTHMGNMIFCNVSFDSEQIKAVRAMIETAGVCAGISRMDGGIVVLRMFGRRADDVVRFFDLVYETVYF